MPYAMERALVGTGALSQCVMVHAEFGITTLGLFPKLYTEQVNYFHLTSSEYCIKLTIFVQKN